GGKLLWTASGGVRFCDALAFSADGKTLVTGGAIYKETNAHSGVFAETTLWDTATGKVLRKLDEGNGSVCAMAFALGGSRPAIVSDSLRLYDPSKGTMLGQFRNPADPAQNR